MQTYRTHEAGIMPGEAQSLQKFVPCLDGEVTAMAAGTEKTVIV